MELHTAATAHAQEAGLQTKLYCYIIIIIVTNLHNYTLHLQTGFQAGVKQLLNSWHNYRQHVRLSANATLLKNSYSN